MKGVILSIIALLVAFASTAQVQGVEKNSAFIERIYFGGGLDLQFNNYWALVGASPSVGYMLTRSTSAGFGITYQYIQTRVTKESTNVYGYRFFLRQNIISQLFAYAQYERLSYRRETFNPESDRVWVNTPYIGGGWYQPISDRAGFQIIALYNLNVSNNRSQSSSPWIFRTGITYSPF